MATPREILKYYFRKHALPTEQQFAELIDAFVHVDEDTIPQEKIDGLINALADKVSSETFESFKTEIQETVTNNGGDLSALTARVTTAEGNITTLRDDVDTNADNISGLNQRVEALEERPQITVDSTLDGESTNPVENKAVTEALGGKADSADVTALSERVSTLENAEPPQVTGSYLKQIADLDSYEGTEGEIVQYIGATNENYRRGFCYERKTNSVTIPSETYYVELPKDFPGTPAGLYTLNRTVQENIKKVQQTFTDDDGTEYYSGYYEQGGYVWNDSGFYKITENSNPGSLNETLTLENGLVLTKKANARQTSNLTSYKEYINSHGDILKWSYGPILITTDSGGSKTAVTFVSPFIGGDWEKYNNNSSSLVLGESGWTVIPVSPCVN